MTRPSVSRGGGFTLMEIMVASAIFLILLGVSLSAMQHTANAWRQSSSLLEAFQGARVAYDLMTRQLSQATLNTYLDYDDPATPTRYLRKSELHFVAGPAGGDFPGVAGSGGAVFFQAPASFTEDAARYGGLDGALNICGFYVQFGPLPGLPAHAGEENQKYRYRLMNLQVPVEKNKVFSNTAFSESDFAWFKDHLADHSYVVADNVIALIVHPEDPSDATLFTTPGYNSLTGWKDNPQPLTANQLPPTMAVTLVAIDENSARRLENGSTPPALIREVLDEFQVKLAATPNNPRAALEQMEASLGQARVNYRVFTSKVPMRESRWTKN